MMILIGIATLVASAILVLLGLRMVATDTLDALVSATVDAKQNGILLPKIAFALLWVMIFSLSYL